MARTMISVEVQAPLQRLFDCATEEWESGSISWMDWRIASGRRLGHGFGINCSARPLGLSGRIELEVRRFRRDRGWLAVSRSGPRLFWELSFRPANSGSLLVCCVTYVPARLVERLKDGLIGRRRRSRALGAWMRRVKALAEREEAIGRLRGRGGQPLAGGDWTSSSASLDCRTHHHPSSQGRARS